MKLKIIKLISILAIISGIAGLNFTPTLAAKTPDNVCDNRSVTQEVKDAAGCTETSRKQLPNVVTGILNAIIGVCGLVAVVYVIIGGYNYMTSTGDPGKVDKAKKTILYALIGIAVCVLSFAVVNFVIINFIRRNPSNYSDQPSCTSAGFRWSNNKCSK